MKKLILILTLAVSTLFVSAQPYCQPSFGWQTGGNQVYFFGYADTATAPSDSVLNWTWTFTGGGASYTATGQYPTMSTLSPNTLYYACVTINTQSGCSGTFCDSVYFDNCNLVVSVQSLQPTSGQCDGSAYATASGGTVPYTYLWSNANETTSSITGLCAGTYTVYATDAAGCAAQASFYLVDSTNVGCNAYFTYTDLGSGTYQFNAYNDSVNPIVAYAWTFSGGTPSSSVIQNPFIVYNIPNMVSIVCLTVTTANGQTCTYCDSIFVGGANPCTMTATLDITPVSVIGGNDGAIDVTVFGGTPPYSFLWNTGETTEDLSDLTSGYYTLNVYDNNPACPNGMYYTAYIYEPYDTTNGNYVVDTLTSPILDTCLNFVPDSSYISQINIINNTDVVVTWVFEYQGQIQTLDVTYTFGANGNYMVTLTINCGSKTLTTYSSFIHIDATLGVSNVIQDKDIVIFPNPASSFFNIEATPPYNYTITNISGQVICSKTSEIGLSTVNSTDLPTGIYFVTITNKGYTNISKIIISR